MKRLLVAALAALISSQAMAQGQGGGEMPPTPVSFVQVAPEALPIINELPGRISATRVAEVRPRIGGIVLERVFEQGSLVQAGDVLYRIDPAQYRVQVASAQGTLARAQAAQKNAQTEANRQEELRQRNVSSGSSFDTAVSNLAQADADVAVAQAQLQEAQLNLDYTEVRAPITEGALVAAQTDVMATIQQLDPVYADFTQSSSQVLALRRAMEAGQLVATAPGEARVQIVYDDGTQYDHPGKLLFSEATVDATTGQVTLRAEVPNPDGYLLPGLYVRVRIEQAINNAALAVPQMAVQRAGDGSTSVYVIGEDGSVQPRPVTLGNTVGNRWTVTGGLNAGDRVVVEGVQKMAPGMKVDAAPYQPQTADQGQAAPAATDGQAQGENAQGQQPAN